MANDGGFLSKLEQSYVDALAVLQYNGSDVFKTAEVWKHQIGITAAGMEALDRYAPCAFVSRGSKVDSAREGGYDLRQIADISILIGQTSREEGICRFGDATHLGTNKIRDLVIAALERSHPGGSIGCDESYFIDDIEILDQPKRHVIEMIFETSKMTPLP